MSQYDELAATYDSNINTRSDREQVIIPTARHYLGDIEGFKVLDLTCGSGFFTRRIRQWGASEVLGIDISVEMIKLAEKEEERSPLAVEYRVGDVVSLGRIGSYDTIFAAFLLHYAKSPEELFLMAENIRKNLRPGGRFVTINSSPFMPYHVGRKYDLEIEVSEMPPRDGTKIRRRHFEGNRETFIIEHFHYEPNTYESALRAAGFASWSWLPLITSPDADPEYWREYTTDFVIKGLVATA